MVLLLAVSARLAWELTVPASPSWSSRQREIKPRHVRLRIDGVDPWLNC